MLLGSMNFHGVAKINISRHRNTPQGHQVVDVTLTMSDGTALDITAFSAQNEPLQVTLGDEE